MKHSHHCHCGLKEQLHKFRAGKLGLLGGVLIVGHLLFHVAECLILPAIFVGFSGHHHSESHEASAEEIIETTFANQVFYNSQSFQVIVVDRPLTSQIFYAPQSFVRHR